MAHPRAILFDLDDTILSAYGRPEAAWRAIANEMSDRLFPISPALAAETISAFGKDFWSDPTRHKTWRMQIEAARRTIVATAFASLADAGHRLPSPEIAEQLADRFSAYREEQICLFPNALNVIDQLRQRGLRLALVTNGAAKSQRAKIDRFDLAHRFDHVQIEEEAGFGKPDEQAYLHAMTALDVVPSETWMVGDNLEWEVAAPQRLGIFAVWHDVEGRGLPPSSRIRPDLIIHALSDLLRHLPAPSG